jgi:hypothetical protein
MSDISVVRNSILTNEFKKQLSNPNLQVKGSNLQGSGKIDANSDGQISSRELQNAAKKAGINLTELTKEDKLELRTQISKLIKQGVNVTETNPMVFSFVVTPSTDDVKSGALGEDGKPVTFNKGQTGQEIKKFNQLLANIGFPAIGDKFQDSTENMVKDFQLRNFFEKDIETGELKPKLGYENIVLGVVDSKTLEAMEEATKLQNPYEKQVYSENTPVINTNPTNPQTTVVTPTTTNQQTTVIIPTTTNTESVNTNQTTSEVNTNNTNVASTNSTEAVESTQTLSPGELGKFEEVRNQIKKQIVESFISKGLSPQEAEEKANEAFKLGNELAGTAVKQDKSMATDGMCYTAVKRNLEQAMNIGYKRYTPRKGGDHARTASETLFKQNSNLFQKVKLPISDVQYLPPGAVVVYHPANKAKAGHIGVQTIQLKTPEQQRKGIQGVPVTNVYEQDGKIIGLDVRAGNKTVKYDIKDGKVFDQNGKETNLKFDHADISDKQRDNPWAGVPVDVFFPLAKK